QLRPARRPAAPRPRRTRLSRDISGAGMLARLHGAVARGGTARVRFDLPRDSAVRCSLLTLSSYLDRELPPDRAGELEAHLIACPRCSTGLGYLREEAERIRGLSAARVPVHATEQLLVTVGLVEQRVAAGTPMRYDDEPPVPHVATPMPDVGMPAQFEPSFDF